MTAPNHAMTGAIIGLTIASPIAMLVAIVSHFVLDAIPHYSDDKIKYSSKTFKSFLGLQVALCLLLVLVLAVARPQNWLLASVCAFLATSPDFMWAPKFFRDIFKKHKTHKSNWVIKFHEKIQWFEKPIGSIVEVVWGAGAIYILAILI